MLEFAAPSSGGTTTKRLILAMAITLVAAVPADGQSLTVFGGLGGAAATMSGDIGGDVGRRYGLAATAGVDHAVTGLIGLQARAGYIQKGFQGSEEDDLLGALGGHAALSYVDFSALARIGDSPVHGLLGTSVGIPVSCEIGVSIEGINITTDCDEDEVDIDPAVDTSA